MNHNEQSERRKILDMIEAGQLSPEEGRRLLSSLDGPGDRVQCPWCAEAIPTGSPGCPECGTRLAPESGGPWAMNPRAGFDALSRLGKVLVLYTALACAIVILTNVTWLPNPASLGPLLLGGVGMASAVLIWRGHPAGWGLAVLWAALQIPVLTVDGHMLNRQAFTVSVRAVVNGTGVGINLVGIVLLALFLRAKGAARFIKPAGRLGPAQKGMP